VAFAPDGQTLFASGWRQNIGYWNLAQPTEMLTLSGHSGGVNGLAVAPDGRWLATAGGDGTARLWSLGTGIKLTAVSSGRLIREIRGIEGFFPP